MVRKIWMGVALVLILAVAGAYVLFKTQGDALLRTFSAYVEDSTGSPLVMDAMPSLTFFPQLGLDLGRASWGRRDGDVSLRFERASVRVAAAALLTGRLDITDMEVDGLDMTVRLADAKAQAVPAAPATPAAGAPPARTAADPEAVLVRILTVSPNALTLRDGRVNLIRSGGSTTEFSHLDLTLKNVRPGADTGLILKADVKGSQPDFSGVLELNAGALLADSGLKVSLRKAVFTPRAGLPVDAPVTLSGEGRYSLRDGALNLTQTMFSSPVLQASLSGTIASLPALARDPVRARGTSSLRFQAQGSPRAVLDILGLTPPRVDPAALSAAALSGDLTLDQGVLNLTSLDGSLDATSFGGRLEYRLHPPALSGELQVSDVRLDSCLPPSPKDTTAPAGGAAPDSSGANGPAKGGEAAAGQAWTAWPELHLVLRIHSVEGNGIRVEDIQTRLEGKDGTYALNPLTCRAFGSPVTAAVTADMKRSGAGRDTAAAVSINLSAPQIDLRQLSTTLFPAIPLEGVGTLNTSLSCSTGRPLATLSGKGSLSAAPVTVHVDVLPPNAPVSPEAARNTRFDKAMLTFTANDGVVTITDCALTAPGVNAAGKGIINLPSRTLDLSGTVQLPGLAVLPVRLTGPLSAPTYSLNARTTFEAVDRTLKEQGVDLRQEIQKGLGRLFRKK